ncbi:MAG: hypothetical protein A2W91_04885 [Bacteroidetes bacterium GWF2_38_335]|nr:MAG: hypothetical protein A2W91_04885 [Bacteroidetes bacterium GWF2_38_335]OFY79834.1 MAG: hypothetical protein A2281_10535 [Bacteroidetes bacterium RIFOXYA12_FULL_38_20]
MKTNLFLVLIKKEFSEQWRSSRFLILLLVFLFFGIISPLTAKFMPDIISSMVKEQNITIQMPEGTWKDAMEQFVKNISQIGVFILILLNMGAVAREKENGTASFLLVKPVSRNQYIICKFFSRYVLLFVSIAIGFLALVLYTKVFFGSVPVLLFAESVLILYLYLMVVQSISIFFSIVLKNQIPAGILAFVIILLVGLFSMIDNVGIYSPSQLIEESQTIISNSVINWQPFAGSLILILCCNIFGNRLFRNWES